MGWTSKRLVDSPQASNLAVRTPKFGVCRGRRNHRWASIYFSFFKKFDAILLSPLSFLSQQSNVKLNALLLVVGKFL